MNKQNMVAVFTGSSIGLWHHNILMAMGLALIAFLADKFYHYLWKKYIKKKI